MGAIEGEWQISLFWPHVSPSSLFYKHEVQHNESFGPLFSDYVFLSHHIKYVEM